MQGESPPLISTCIRAWAFLASHVSSANPVVPLLSKELQTLPRGRADPPQRRTNVFREESRLDGQNIVARDFVRRIGVLKNDVNVRGVRVSMVRHAESFGRALESVQREIGIGGPPPIPKIVRFHFTPTHACRLNQVEIWFSILTTQSLNGASFTRVKELIAHIDAFIERYNQTARPFLGTKSNVHQKRLKPCFAD